MTTNLIKTGTLINKKFREFFMPTVLASMASQLGTIINGIIVGNFISANAMAAVSACIPLNQITYALAVLISIGSSALIAIASGVRDKARADYIFSVVATISTFIGVILAILFVSHTYEISKLLSSVEDLRILMYEYLLVLAWRSPLFLISFTWQTLLRTDGMAKIVSRGVVIGQISNVILSFLLVSNGFGIKGAGIALITSDIVTISYSLKKYFSSNERTRNFCSIFGNIREFFKQVLELLKSGVPAACSTGLISVKIWAIYQILGATGGSGAMTLYAVCMACLSVVSMCIAGCNGAMMPIVGMIYGEKDFVGVRNLVKYVLRFALTLTGTFVAFAILFPQIILSVYNVPVNLFAEGATALRLFSISLLGVTATFLVMYYYSTIQQRIVANILSITEGVLVVVPAAWILSKHFGLNGVWMAFILAEIAGFFMVWIYSKHICKNSNGKLNDIFLIEQKEPNIIYDVSSQANLENAVKLSEEAVKTLENNNIPKNTAIKVGVALEEITVNMEKINDGKKVDVDVRIKSEDSKIIIAIRDNGKSFNPLEYQPQEDYKTDGIIILKSLIKNIQYSRALSLNQTIIEV